MFWYFYYNHIWIWLVDYSSTDALVVGGVSFSKKLSGGKDEKGHFLNFECHLSKSRISALTSLKSDFKRLLRFNSKPYYVQLISFPSSESHFRIEHCKNSILHKCKEDNGSKCSSEISVETLPTRLGWSIF